MNGDIVPISALASGVAAPNKMAAVSATRIAERLGFMMRIGVECREWISVLCAGRSGQRAAGGASAKSVLRCVYIERRAARFG
ncbi:hypothetical protein BvRS1_45890 [Burkholderia vietnamiensis]|nr:hypothetical protein BvRS1_45890 [Burkholderia vietnamiensis]